MTKPTILITGAAGNIGRKLRQALHSQFTLKLLDLQNNGDPDIMVIDLSRWHPDLPALFTGVDAVLHLAADPDERKPWGELVGPNVDALNTVFLAAMLARVPRLIFASSNHAMGGYKDDEDRPGQWLTTNIEPKPGTRFESPSGVFHDSIAYGSMKFIGERLGLTYAAIVQGVYIAIRVGWVNRIGENRPEDLPPDAPNWFKRMWLSTPDLCQLIQLAIESPQQPGTSLIVNGMSDNAGMVWDIAYTSETLGYQPQDGLTEDFKDKAP